MGSIYIEIKKTRFEVARFIEKQMDWKNNKLIEKGGRHHYGWMELRELMDFIYGGEPDHDEMLRQNKDQERIKVG